MSKSKVAKLKVEGRDVIITPPNFQYALISIKGTAPLVINRKSKRVEEEIRGQQEAGGKSKNTKRIRKPKDFERLFNDARFKAPEGWDGINASAFRNAMISACRVAGFVMTRAKLSLFIEPDGFDVIDGTPLVRIRSKKEPEMSVMSVILPTTKKPDLASRPMWREWGCELKIKFDADQFGLEDVVNLMARVGGQVGICCGRPDSKDSNGIGFGTFEIVN